MANYKMWQSLGFATQSVIGIFLDTYDTFYIKVYFYFIYLLLLDYYLNYYGGYWIFKYAVFTL